MMNKISPVFVAALMIFTLNTSGQSVSINSDRSVPATDAMLDVKSGNKGILIPRIALSGTDDSRTVNARTESLLIYNTAITTDSTAVSPGYYYWSGSKWIRLINNDDSRLSGWLLGGNVGTTSANDFIGTIDSADLQFRVNNISVGRLSGNGNIFWGLHSGDNNKFGYSNIALGTEALKNNISKNNLVAIGDSALFSNGIGAIVFFQAVGNTAIGSKSMFSNSTGYDNTAIGYESLRSNTTGFRNTANGRYSLFSNTTGVNNIATGYKSLYYNTTGSNNSACGSYSLFSNTTGTYNTANGAYSLYYNTTGSVNTASGTHSLNSNTTGSLNTASGDRSLHSNSTGDYNTAIGTQSMIKNAAGHYNTANGFQSLYNNSTGNGNVAIGYYSLYGNGSGNNNTGIGHKSNGAVGNLFNATAIGSNAQVACSDCMVLGSIAGINEATSNVNVGIGITNPGFPLNFAGSLGDKISLFGDAGAHYGFGIQNGMLQIHTDIGSSAIAFGYGKSDAFTENMRIQGNGNLYIRGSVTANSSFYTSDSRYKTDIEPIGDALEKITQLNGYHYNWIDKEQDPSLQSGVIAQEVEAIFPELVRKDEKGFLSVNYVGLVPYLIQSVKEQQKQIVDQKAVINQLKKDVEKINNLEAEIEKLKKKSHE